MMIQELYDLCCSGGTTKSSQRTTRKAVGKRGGTFTRRPRLRMTGQTDSSPNPRPRPHSESVCSWVQFPPGYHRGLTVSCTHRIPVHRLAAGLPYPALNLRPRDWAGSVGWADYGKPRRGNRGQRGLESKQPTYRPLRGGATGLNRSLASSHTASSALPSRSKGNSHTQRLARSFSKAANPAPATTPFIIGSGMR